METLEPAPAPRKSWVYVVWCEGFVKIGTATNPIQRLDHFRISNPFPVELLGVIETNDAPMAEADLHNRYRQFHVRGEWFKMPDDVLMALSRRFHPNPPFKMREQRQFFMLKRLVPDELH